MFAPSYSEKKLKVNLKLATQRLKVAEKKKSEMALRSRKEIADYLRDKKVDRARIRVEHIIREDYMVEALEIIEMSLDLVLARIGVLSRDQAKVPPISIAASVESIIWAYPKIGVEYPDLKIVMDQFKAKYGKDYMNRIMNDDSNNNVHKKLKSRLDLVQPKDYIIEKYLEMIAQSYNVDYVADPKIIEAHERAQAAAAEATLIEFPGDAPIVPKGPGLGPAPIITGVPGGMPGPLNQAPSVAPYPTSPHFHVPSPVVPNQNQFGVNFAHQVPQAPRMDVYAQPNSNTGGQQQSSATGPSIQQDTYGTLPDVFGENTNASNNNNNNDFRSKAKAAEGQYTGNSQSSNSVEPPPQYNDFYPSGPLEDKNDAIYGTGNDYIPDALEPMRTTVRQGGNLPSFNTAATNQYQPTDQQGNVIPEIQGEDDFDLDLPDVPTGVGGNQAPGSGPGVGGGDELDLEARFRNLRGP